MKRKTSLVLAAALVIATVLPLAAGQNRTGNAGISRNASPSSAADIQSIARDLGVKAQGAADIAWNQRSRTPVELYVALCGFAGSTLAYSQMADDAREEAGLSSAARGLVNQVREIDGLLGGTGAPELQAPWRLVQEQMARLSSLYTLGYGYGSGVRETAGPASSPGSPTAAAAGGRFRWRGRVDGEDYVIVRGKQVTVMHLEARPVRDATYELPNPLPQQPMQLKLTKLKGRGSVEIVRQPSEENEYMLAVLVEDPAGGDDLYEFEVVW